MQLDTSSFPLVSVVMACFNGESFIQEQLQSILDQHYPNLEIIIVDDASSDNTSTLLHRFAQQDDRVRIYVNDQNIGYIKTFERALSLGRGEFIALSDQDDIWHPEKISRLLAQIGSFPLVYCDSLLINAKGEELGKRLSQQKRLTTITSCLSYAIGGSAPGHAMLIRKELIQSCFPFPDILPHDYWIGFIASCSGGLRYIDEPLNRYRQHDQNVFGAGTGSRRAKSKPDRKQQLSLKRARMSLLADACPDERPEKQVYLELAAAYRSFSLLSNVRRMLLFFRHRHQILSYKHRSGIQKWLFCLKTFVRLP